MTKMFGWAGKILCVNLNDSCVSDVPTLKYAERFIGGKGIASRLYWEHMHAGRDAFDPDSHLYFMNGPLCATQAPAASRWLVAGKSPMAVPEQYASGNLGGHLGAALKWCGLDGLDICGASAKPVILLIEKNGKCLFEEASHLWGQDTFETIAALQKTYGRKACVATIGRSGEQRVRFANIIGPDEVSATKGFGAVMGSKNLKAIVVRADKVSFPAARPEAFKKVRREITSLWKGETSDRYWTEIMLEDVEKIKNAYCYGCPGICNKGLYQNKKGEKGFRRNCFSAYYYAYSEQKKTGRIADASFYATHLANRHGLCALEFIYIFKWLPNALRKGIIDPAATGLNPDEIGTREWIEKLVSLIISRQGIGDILAEGSGRAIRQLGAEHLLEGVVTESGFIGNLYNPRLFLSTAPMYATEPVFPITQLHGVSFPMVKWMIWNGTEGMLGFLTTEKLRLLAKVFWGDEKAAEFDSPDKMGAAAAIMQNRAYAKENLILCDWFWPIDYSGNTATGVGDPALEAKLFSAVVGEDMDESAFLRSGERCANLYRSIQLCEGRRGRMDDVLAEPNFSNPLEKEDPPVGLFNPELIMPGKDGRLFTCKGTVVKRDIFRKVMDDYYTARGWDVKTGLLTETGLRKLDLQDMIPELAGRGFLID
jgi:aldehyde:ferredoxin oxidoreductase